MENFHERLRLRWEKNGDGHWLAYVGKVNIASVTLRSKEIAAAIGRRPYNYKVYGVSTRWITKGRGDVGTLHGAKVAVRRAWHAWLTEARLDVL